MLFYILKPIGIFIFFLLFILLIIFLFASYKNKSGSVKILNKSKVYSLSYRENLDFLNIIKDLEVFTKKVNVHGKKSRVNKLIIELVDSPQAITYIDNHSSFTNSRVLFRENEKSLVIRVYIPLEETNTAEKRLNEIFLQEVITKLYAISHENTTTKTLNEKIPLLMRVFKSNPEKNPFRIIVQK